MSPGAPASGGRGGDADAGAAGHSLTSRGRNPLSLTTKTRGNSDNNGLHLRRSTTPSSTNGGDGDGDDGDGIGNGNGDGDGDDDGEPGDVEVDRGGLDRLEDSYSSVESGSELEGFPTYLDMGLYPIGEGIGDSHSKGVNPAALRRKSQTEPEATAAAPARGGGGGERKVAKEESKGCNIEGDHSQQITADASAATHSPAVSPVGPPPSPHSSDEAARGNMGLGGGKMSSNSSNDEYMPRKMVEDEIQAWATQLTNERRQYISNIQTLKKAAAMVDLIGHQRERDVDEWGIDGDRTEPSSPRPVKEVFDLIEEKLNGFGECAASSSTALIIIGSNSDDSAIVTANAEAERVEAFVEELDDLFHRLQKAIKASSSSAASSQMRSKFSSAAKLVVPDFLARTAVAAAAVGESPLPPPPYTPPPLSSPSSSSYAAMSLAVPTGDDGATAPRTPQAIPPSNSSSSGINGNTASVDSSSGSSSPRGASNQRVTALHESIARLEKALDVRTGELNQAQKYLDRVGLREYKFQEEIHHKDIEISRLTREVMQLQMQQREAEERARALQERHQAQAAAAALELKDLTRRSNTSALRAEDAELRVKELERVS